MMTLWKLSYGSLLVAVFVLSNCITWTSAKHHFKHNIRDLRSRLKRQGALSSSFYDAHDDTCSLPIETGSCTSSLHRWGYDSNSRSCKQFTWSGCEGNSNQFKTEADCQTRCSQFTSTEQSKPPKQERRETIDHNNGTRNGCAGFKFGCCYDNKTEAPGPDKHGCPCNATEFGCCPDGVTIATSPDQQSCGCQYSTHGCCSDGRTAATGPNGAGCVCFSSKYGCCPDGQTEAAGFNFLGCGDDVDIPENKQAACTLASDAGPCTNFRNMWFYDNDYGGCSRFWYGGCEGNSNRFSSKQECKNICVHPNPKEACKLPAAQGPCKSNNVRWYFDTTREQCLPFRYGGCLGNANNFDTRELCRTQCASDRTTEPYATTKSTLTTGTELIQPGSRDDKIATLRCLFHRNLPNSITSDEDMNINSSDSGVYVCVADSELDNITQQVNLVVKENVNEVIPDCLRKEAECLQLNCEFDIQYSRSVDGCETCSCSTPEPDCEKEQEECKKLTCKYGVERIITANGCERCKCVPDNPCDPDLVTCLDNEQCVVMPESDPTQEVTYYAECRLMSSIAVELTTLETTTLEPTALDTDRPVNITVPVSIHLSTTQNTLKLGTDLHIVCEVDGYPEPEVHWTKDGEIIVPDDRILITGTTITKLDISRVMASDSGRYACHATNSYSSQFLDTEVKVLKILVPGNCTDNSFFANCQLIVHGKYCTHKFYSRYCCKSCVEAGQLNPKSPWI